MTSEPAPRPVPVVVVVLPEWARLLARLQQLRQAGAWVLLDLDSMTLYSVGRPEHLATPGRIVLE